MNASEDRKKRLIENLNVPFSNLNADEWLRRYPDNMFCDLNLNINYDKHPNIGWYQYCPDCKRNRQTTCCACGCGHCCFCAYRFSCSPSIQYSFPEDIEVTADLKREEIYELGRPLKMKKTLSETLGGTGGVNIILGPDIEFIEPEFFEEGAGI